MVGAVGSNYFQLMADLKSGHGRVTGALFQPWFECRLGCRGPMPTNTAQIAIWTSVPPVACPNVPCSLA